MENITKIEMIFFLTKKLNEVKNTPSDYLDSFEEGCREGKINLLEDLLEDIKNIK